MKHSPVRDGYCGCCGREVEQAQLWCRRCEKHVGHWTKPLEEQPYKAMHGVECPYAPRNQIMPDGSVTAVEED